MSTTRPATPPSPDEEPDPNDRELEHARPPVLLRAAEGFVAGLVATAVMTGARFAAKEAGLVDRRPPQSEVVGRLRAIAGRTPWGHRAERSATIAHYAFGAVAGAIYGVIDPRRARPAGGVLYAGAIWAISYLGVLPRVGLMPRPTRDDLGRQVVTAADHVVYGMTLDALLGVADRVYARR